MDKNIEIIKESLNVNFSSFSLTSLILNLIVGFFISIIIKFHYKKFSSTLNNREDFTNVFPFILLTTVLVISIVKSSLALSLGLVGALSIVRFRTPIKEPEEISYIFLSIAIGLATGAYQFKAATIGLLLVITFIYLYDYLEKKKSLSNYIRLSISGIKRSDTNKVIDILSENCEKVVFNSMSISSKKSNEETLISLSIVPDNFKKINKLTEQLYDSFPDCTLNLLDIE